ncbi:MAG: hypothetical protein WA052_01560 [Microgenomates group bacterium]
MEDKEAFDNTWIEIGGNIANGDRRLSLGNLLAIHHNLELEKIDLLFLPDIQTVTGTVKQRREAIFYTAETLWGKTPEEWQEMEIGWLAVARSIYSLPRSSGKHRLSEVVSAEILVRIVAAANLAIKVVNKNHSHLTGLYREALWSINIILMEVCAKGRTRTQRMSDMSDTTVFDILKGGGLMIGTGEKYLPNPSYALPKLLMMLHRDYLRPEVYLS